MATRRALVRIGLNVGLAAFVVGLLLDVEPAKMLGTPVLGLAILLGIATNLPAIGAREA